MMVWWMRCVLDLHSAVALHWLLACTWAKSICRYLGEFSMRTQSSPKVVALPWLEYSYTIYSPPNMK